MKKIPIPSKPGVFALVDDEDHEWLSLFRWHLAGGRNNYAQTDIPAGHKKYLNVKMHRIILGIVGRPGIVDHINGNGLDNQKENLRICANNENSYNRVTNKNCKSGLKGVRLLHQKDKGGNFVDLPKPWRSTINVDKKRIDLGCFATKEEAAEAYKEASLKYHGEFSVFRGQLANK